MDHVRGRPKHRHARYRAAAFLHVRPQHTRGRARPMHSCACTRAFCLSVCKSGERRCYCKRSRVQAVRHMDTYNVTVAHMPPEITARKQTHEKSFTGSMRERAADIKGDAHENPRSLVNPPGSMCIFAPVYRGVYTEPPVSVFTIAACISSASHTSRTTS